MKTRAKYYANLVTGKSLYLCAGHISKVARRLDDAGRMSLKKGVRSIGSLHKFTPKTCCECKDGDHGRT